MRQRIEDLVQGISPDQARESTQQIFTDLILEWARDLPQTRYGVADIGAGEGKEVAKLNSYGLKCVGIDPIGENPYHLLHLGRKNPVGKVIRGTASSIALPKKSLSGILLKETLLFLTSII